AEHLGVDVQHLPAGRVEHGQPVVPAGLPAGVQHGEALTLGEQGAGGPVHGFLPRGAAHGDVDAVGAIGQARAFDHAVHRRHRGARAEAQRPTVRRFHAAAGVAQRDALAVAGQQDGQRLGGGHRLPVALALDVQAADLAAAEQHAHPGVFADCRVGCRAGCSAGGGSLRAGRRDERAGQAQRQPEQGVLTTHGMAPRGRVRPVEAAARARSMRGAAKSCADATATALRLQCAPAQRRSTSMKPFGTPHSDHAVRVLLLGSGELGKELTIELQRYAVEVIAVDRYADAPAMQVAHRSHVIDMLDGAALRRVIEAEHPDLVVPEIEAIHTPTLVEMEREGLHVIPTARAAWLTMDREGIRRLAAQELELLTSPYRFCDNEADYRRAVADIGYPFVIKPVMSSSGKGQSIVRNESELQPAWDYAQSGGRAGQGRVIVEGFVDFDYEITLLTVRHQGGTSFCAPIGHRQEDGDYRESWQPQPMSGKALAEAQRQAAAVSNALGGWGVFGMEFFVKGDNVIFSEVSPRPHDTGLVTQIS